MNRSTFNTLATQGSTSRSGNKHMLLVVAAAMWRRFSLRSPRRVPEQAQSYNRKWQR